MTLIDCYNIIIKAMIIIIPLSFSWAFLYWGLKTMRNKIGWFTSRPDPKWYPDEKMAKIIGPLLIGISIIILATDIVCVFILFPEIDRIVR